MANFAFDALKSLDYNIMTIGLDGDLAGDVITKVSFDGIKQGQGTKQNFITRQVANLPLRFNVNVRAPFYRLVSSMNPQPPPGALPSGALPSGALPSGALPPGIPPVILQQPAKGVQPAASPTMP